MGAKAVRILVVSPRQCFPATSGAKLREYYFLRGLGEWAEVTLVGYRDPGSAPVPDSALPFCRTVRFLPKPPAYRPMQVARGLFGKWPLPVLNYTSDAMLQEVVRLSAGTDFDLVHLEGLHMVRCAEILRDSGNHALTVYNWHNIESELMGRYATTANSPARRIYASLTRKKLERLEAEMLRDASGHLVCSAREREKLLQIDPSARIAVVGNGVDCDAFAGDAIASDGSSDAQGQSGKRSILFVGSMDYPPNVEGVVWFGREIWPRLRETFPELEFVVVGARPAASVLALREIPGIVVTGTVPDVRPYYRDAFAAVVPLKTGGGTRLKILEAMAAGVPVISTVLGAEGLGVTPGRDFLETSGESAEPWIGYLNELLNKPERRAALVNAGLRLVRSRYDWKALGGELVSTYREWLTQAGRSEAQRG